jgi:hypothetical protein
MNSKNLVLSDKRPYPKPSYSTTTIFNSDLIDEDDNDELTALITGMGSVMGQDMEMSTTSTVESTKNEILSILNKRKTKYHSTSTLNGVLAPIPKKLGSNNNLCIIERVSRPYDTI